MAANFETDTSQGKAASYATEMVELYNENYLGEDYELRKVEKILGRRIRVFQRYDDYGTHTYHSS